MTQLYGILAKYGESRPTIVKMGVFSQICGVFAYFGVIAIP
jgi:hypothetical protein